MIIDCIADLHGNYPKLEGGNLLIVAGDLTARDTEKEYGQFEQWLWDQKYSKKIIVPGNHDNSMFEDWELGFPTPMIIDTEFLCDSGTEFTYYPPLEPGGEKEYERKTFKIWGSPWTKTFPGMNPKCKAFTVDTEEELAEKWKLIPEDTHILVTHGPSKLMYDETVDDDNVGSTSLLRWIADHSNTLKLHVYGHIHEAYGMWDKRKIQKRFNGKEGPVFVNCSHVNENYQQVNKPIRVIL